ncbi:MAG: cell division protein SepF [Eubacteriales bacterium]
MFDKVLHFMGFDEELVDEQEEKLEEPEEQPWSRKKEKGTLVSLPSHRQMRVVVAEPRVFEDVTAIAENLKNRRPVIINLEQADSELARRVVDFVSGATYALSGRMQKVGNGIFLSVPNNMDIASELKDQGGEKGIFSWVR